jgi:hypothetical protein
MVRELRLERSNSLADLVDNEAIESQNGAGGRRELGRHPFDDWVKSDAKRGSGNHPGARQLRA